MAPPGVAGIIEGSVTISPEPDGRVSFRVLIGTGAEQAGDRDLLELIISSEHLSRALGACGAMGTPTAKTIPCHVGFCHHVTNPAA